MRKQTPWEKIGDTRIEAVKPNTVQASKFDLFFQMRHGVLWKRGGEGETTKDVNIIYHTAQHSKLETFLNK